MGHTKRQRLHHQKQLKLTKLSESKNAKSKKNNDFNRASTIKRLCTDESRLSLC